MFFSEEKNQKTFISLPLPGSRPWPGSIRWRRNRSLLLLFFRKEDPCLCPVAAGHDLERMPRDACVRDGVAAVRADTHKSLFRKTLQARAILQA